MADLGKITSDPEFSRLSDADKYAVIAHIDPTFNSLQDNDKRSVLTHLSGAGDVRSQIAARKASPPATAHGDPNASQEGNFAQAFPQLRHPIEATKGFVSALNPLPMIQHPIDAFNNDRKARGAAFDRLNTHNLIGADPASPEAGEALRDLFEYAIPGVGPAFAGAGRDLNSTDPKQRARGFGTALAVTSGPAMVEAGIGAAGNAAGKIGPSLVNGAEVRYAKVLDPKGIHPELAQQTAREMIADRVKLNDPRTEVAEYAKRKMGPASNRLDDAISNMANPVDGGAVLSSIDAAHDGLFNPETGAAIAPDARNVARSLARYRNDNVAGNLHVGADGRLAISPELALELKRQFDKKPGARGMYGGDASIPAADVTAQSHIANALREQLNSDPHVASANADLSRLATIEDTVAPNASKGTTGSPLASLARFGAEGGAAGLAHMVGGSGAAKLVGGTIGAVEMGRFVRDIVNSPGFQTASALTRDKLGRMIQSKDWNGVLSLGKAITEPAPRGPGEAPKPPAVAAEVVGSKGRFFNDENSPLTRDDAAAEQAKVQFAHHVNSGMHPSEAMGHYNAAWERSQGSDMQSPNALRVDPVAYDSKMLRSMTPDQLDHAYGRVAKLADDALDMEDYQRAKTLNALLDRMVDETNRRGHHSP